MHPKVDPMYYFLLFIHLIVSMMLMVVVLLQQSKGGGLSGAFGGMGAGEASFGVRSVATFLHKATIYLGGTFMALSLVIALISAQSDTGGSLAREAARGVAGSSADLQPLTPVEEAVDAAADGNLLPAVDAAAETPAETPTETESTGENASDEGGN